MNHCEDQETAEAERALVREKCEELLESDCDSSYLHGFMVELYKQQLEENSANKKEILEKVSQLCAKLSQEIDTVRCKYWNFISDSIQRKYSTAL